MPKMTYRQMMESFKGDARKESSDLVVASMIATSLHMQWDGAGAEADNASIADTTAKLMKQKSFKALMKDPMTARLAKEGRHLELIQMLDIKANAARLEKEEYGRKGMAKKDAAFIKDALDAYKNSKNGSAQLTPAQLEKENPLYNDMIKQLEAAQAKTEKGVDLSPEESKALVGAVRKYNDKGTKVAGGKGKQAAGYIQNMCVLNRFMPEARFRNYCEGIRESHPQIGVRPDHFTQERLRGTRKSASQLRNELKVDMLKRGLTEDLCASMIAIRNLEFRKGGQLISPLDLKMEKDSLLGKGSVVKRMMSSPKDREILKDSIEKGNVKNFAKQADRCARNHTIGAAQWRLNRAARALNDGPVNRHFAAEHLATIITANNIAKDDHWPNYIDKAFNDKRDAMMEDAAFNKLVDRYTSDPEFRQKLNLDISLDRSGNAVVEEFGKLKPAPKPEAQAQVSTTGSPKLFVVSTLAPASR